MDNRDGLTLRDSHDITFIVVTSQHTFLDYDQHQCHLKIAGFPMNQFWGRTLMSFQDLLHPIIGLRTSIPVINAMLLFQLQSVEYSSFPSISVGVMEQV
jgi:hypothetical protein